MGLSNWSSQLISKTRNNNLSGHGTFFFPSLFGQEKQKAHSDSQPCSTRRQDKTRHPSRK